MPLSLQVGASEQHERKRFDNRDFPGQTKVHCLLKGVQCLAGKTVYDGHFKHDVALQQVIDASLDLVHVVCTIDGEHFASMNCLKSKFQTDIELAAQLKELRRHHLKTALKGKAPLESLIHKSAQNIQI